MARERVVGFSPTRTAAASAFVSGMRHAGGFHGDAVPPVRGEPDVLDGGDEPLAEQVSSVERPGDVRHIWRVLCALWNQLAAYAA